MLKSHFLIFDKCGTVPHLVGGVMRDQYDGLGYFDVDWLCYSKEGFMEASDHLASLGLYEKVQTKYPNYRYFVDVSPCGTDPVLHQVFYNEKILTPADFLTTHIDVTVAKILYTGNEFIAHPLFAEDVLSRTLRSTSGDLNDIPIARIAKFLDRGYRPLTMF